MPAICNFTKNKIFQQVFLKVFFMGIRTIFLQQIYLPACLPTYLSTYWQAGRRTDQLTDQPTNRMTSQSIDSSIFLSTCIYIRIYISSFAAEKNKYEALMDPYF